MKISVPEPFRRKPVSDTGMAVFRWERGAHGKCRWFDGHLEAAFAVEELGTSMQLADASKGEGRFLETPYFGGTTYNPLDSNPELFRIFGGLEPSEAEFVRFATEFGALGLPVLTAEGRVAEPFRAWVLFWSEMKVVGMMLDAVHHARHLPLLKRSVNLANESIDMSLAAEDTGAAVTIKAIIGSKKLFNRHVWKFAVEGARSEREMLRRCARFWVQTRMNDWMSGEVWPEVGAPGRVVFDSVGGNWHVRLQPGSLAAAMCVQACRALEGGVQQRQCPECLKWYVISSDRALGKRSDAKYCGDPKCRKAAWRRRNATKEGRKS